MGIRCFSGPYFPAFRVNAGKCGPEKLRIRTLFTQCDCVSKNLLPNFHCGSNVKNIPINLFHVIICSKLFKIQKMSLSQKNFVFPPQIQNGLMKIKKCKTSLKVAFASVSFRSMYLSRILLLSLHLFKILQVKDAGEGFFFASKCFSSRQLHVQSQPQKH